MSQKIISSKKKVLIISVGAIILALFTTIYVLSKDDGVSQQELRQNFTTTTTTKKQVGLVTNDNPSCALPRVAFKENAFSIGVPKGWLYEVDKGTVAIMQDETNTTASFLYTAKLKRDLSATAFLNQFAVVFDKTIKNVNGTFGVNNIKEQNGQATADIKATIGKDKMAGRFLVDKTEGFVTLKSYWAPEKELQKQEPLLKQIVGCFARQKVLTLDILAAAKAKKSVKTDSTTPGFSNYTGRYFRLEKPSNFNVTGETDSGIDMTRADGNAGFSYAYVTGAAGSYTPRSWTQKALPQFAGIQSLRLGTGQSISSPINGQVIQSFTFTGLLQGTISVTGKVTVGIYNTPYYGFGTRYSSAFWGIQIATPGVWPSVKTTLQKIQDSVEITDIGQTRRNTLLPPNRPMESSGSSLTSSSTYSDSVSDQASDSWSDAMRGYDTVESPSTGDRYDVPLNSWSSYGPEGPGYYRSLPDGSVELLK